jgi:DNA-binding CsgD family transcriptional regulator
MTPKCAEVMYAALNGESQAALAARLGLSLKGLKYHLTNIYSLAGVNGRVELIGKWQKIKGIAPMPNMVVTVEVPDLPRGGVGSYGDVLDREFEGDC